MDKAERNEQIKLNKWIWVFYLVSCVLICLLIVRDMGQLYGQYNESQMEVIAGLLAEKVNTSIEHIVDNAKQAALIMGENADMTGKEMYNEMQAYVHSTSFISMGLVDETGTFWGKSGEWRDLNKYQYIEKAMEGTQPYITEPYRSSVTATHLITVLLPVYRKEDKKCIIYASFPLERIQEFSQTNALELQPEIALMNAASGNYIACTDGEMAAAGSWNNLILMQAQMEFRNESDHISYMQSLQERADSGMAHFALQNQEYIQGYVQIESMPDWYIAVNISAKSLSDFLVRYQTHIVLYVTVFLLLSLLMVVWHISRQFIQKKKLQRLSELDSLTGLLNKRTFIGEVQKCVQKHREENKGALIFVDVDDFKKYNDTYGHLAGDIVLKNFAAVLTELFSERGFVGRYGGDEFIVFIKDMETREELEKALLIARKRFKNMEIPVAGKISVTFSSGIACFPEHGRTYEELCANADKALYWVKERGKDDFAWYNVR